MLLPLPLLFGAGLPGATWLTLGALPLGLLLIARLYHGAQGAQINPMLGQTGLYQGLLTLLMIVGFAFGGSA
jgi:1,4-dihydroxy-2-naphthoate octaprenyltransferase